MAFGVNASLAAVMCHAAYFKKSAYYPDAIKLKSMNRRQKITERVRHHVPELLPSDGSANATAQASMLYQYIYEG